ncbi:hypothetical protein [Vibrio navarrensis]|uniref:WD40 repeat protein n=1 Tax=Vibrio navarrensis TaxID=29495 RepID=A0A099LX55_9VIBR|nr:hypothetical protein [Vibrio navarrensis]KGK11837.1 hypothetical protein EA26_11185 [Vibrio navarrensis]MBE4615988.1 hypothetical protein [Vibrio navarrensis]QOD67661.1 hypothetical protein IF132_04300 [Vibrio navarrensis]
MKPSPIAMTLAAFLAVGAAIPQQAAAQSVAWDRANESWLTQSSDHFVIHFRNGHEKQAARALDLAEQSHRELVPFFGYQPEEKTEIVLVDEYDFSNGWATVVPYPQIRLIMSPPDEANSLENNDEWMHLLIKHEYTHIMHMEMGGGAIKTLRNIFGRNPFLYPHLMTPSFMLEGLAVYQETNQAAGYGRLQGTGYDMQMRMEVASGEVKSLNQVAVASREWPLGYNYLYGAYFVQYLADTYGDEKVGEFLTSYSRKVIPFFLLNRTARTTFGKDLEQLWSDFQSHIYQQYQGDVTQMTEAAVIGKGKYTAPFLQVVSASDSGLLVNRNDGDGYSKLQRIDGENAQTLSKTKQINSLDVHLQAGVLATRSITYADGRVLSDVFVYQDDRWTQLTEKQRFRMAKWLPDGYQYLASRKVDGLSELWLMDASNPESNTLIWQGEDGDVLGGFSLAPQGDFLVASMKRPQQGWNLERFDLTSATWHKLTDSRAVENAPTMMPDGKVLYSADYDGVFNIYSLDLETQQISQLTREVGGAFEPHWQAGSGLVYQSYDAKGYTLREKERVEPLRTFTVADAQGQYNYVDPVEEVAAKSEIIDYSPWSSLRPRTWLPIISQDENQTLAGFMINGADALNRHQYQLGFAWDTENSLAQYNLGYLYDSRWMIQLERSHDFTTFKQGSSETYRIEQSDSALIQRNHLFTAIEDQLSFAAGVYWDKESEEKKPKFGATKPYVETEESLAGIAATFDNRETYLNVPGIGWGHYLDVVVESNELLGSDYQGEKYQGQWQATFDLPGRSTLSLRLAGGLADSKAKPFRLGGSDQSDEVALFGRETQALRGYDETVQSGDRYVTQRVEASTWLGRVERNWGLYPIGLGDISGTAFVDSGSAWSDTKEYKQLTGAGVSFTVGVRLGYNLELPVTLGYAHGFDSDLGKDQFFFSVAGQF